MTDIVSQHKTITDTPTGMGTGPFTWQRAQTPGLLLTALRPGPYEQEAHFDSLTQGIVSNLCLRPPYVGQPFVAGNIQISKGCLQIIIIVNSRVLVIFRCCLQPSCPVYGGLYMHLQIGTEHTTFVSTITSTSTYAVDYWYYTLTCYLATHQRNYDSKVTIDNTVLY